jgi:hypothetical protein
MASLRRCLRLSCEALERGIYLHVILELRSAEEGGMMERHPHLSHPTPRLSIRELLGAASYCRRL